MTDSAPVGSGSDGSEHQHSSSMSPSPSASSSASSSASHRTAIRDWVLWATLRLGLLAIIVGWVPWPEQVNDLNIYADWATGPLSQGRLPSDQMWQYPPLAGPVFRLGAWLPGDRLGFALLFLGFDAAIMAMLAAQARRTGIAHGRLLWALVPLITGPLLLARFDVVPTTLAVAAVLVAAQPMASGALAAIGAWLKVWPALVIAGLRRRDLPRGLAGAAVASVAIAALVLATTEDAFSFLGGQRDRGLQIESVAAWPFLLARATGASVEVVYQFGAHEVVADGVSGAARIALLATLALLALVAVQRLRGAIEHLPAADVALAALLFSVVTSRVFSGQYFIWLLALGAICVADPATRMRHVVWLLIGAGAATQLVYPWLYSALLDGNPLALIVQTVRIGLTVAATVVAVRVLLTPGPRTQDGLGS